MLGDALHEIEIVLLEAVISMHPTFHGVSAVSAPIITFYLPCLPSRSLLDPTATFPSPRSAWRAFQRMPLGMCSLCRGRGPQDSIALKRLRLIVTAAL